MTQVRKLTGLALLSVAGAAVLLWLGAGVWAMWLGPSWFSAQLKQRFGIDAAIGSLRTDFFHSVSFRDTVLSAPVRGRIAEVKVAFRPWDLFSVSARRRHIFVVTLRNPDITVDATRLSTGSTKSTANVVPFRGAVENGTIEVVTAKGRWNVTGLNGVARVTPFRMELDGEGNVNDWGVLKARLRAGTMAPRNWELRVDSERFSARSALDLAPAPWKERVGAVSGDVKLNAVIRGALHQRLQFADWRIGATSINVAWTAPGQPTAVPVAGSVGFHKDKIQFTDFRVSRTTVNGAVLPPWKDARLDLKVEADHQPVAPLLQAAMPGGGFLDGAVSGSGTVSGSIHDPRAQLDVDGNVRVGALHLPHGSGTVSLNEGTLLAAIDVAGGRVQLHGIDLWTSPRWNAEVQRVSLAELGAANNWTNVGGGMDARFAFDPRAAAASGDLELDNLRWGRMKVAGRHEAALRMKNGAIQATADGGAFVLTAQRTADRYDISEFRFTAAGGTVTASGFVDRRTDAIHIAANADDVPVDLWPPLVGRYPDAAGAVDARGTFAGTIGRPAGEFAVTAERLRFRGSSPTSEASARVSFDGRRVTIDDGQIDRTIAFEGAFDGADRSWSASARLTDASPQVLADLALASQTVSGSLTGGLTASGGRKTVGVSSFTWSTGHYGSAYFDELTASARLDGDTLRVSEATFIRGPQALRGRADLRRNGEAWSFDAITQVQQWSAGPAHLDGEIAATGSVNPSDRRLTAVLTAPVFWISDRSLDALRAEVTASPDGARVRATAGDDQFRLDASVARDGKLKGTLRARNLSIEDLVAPPDRKPDEAPPVGTYDADAALGGTLAAPEVALDVRIARATWRGESLAVDASVRLSTTGVDLPSIKANLESGGRVAANGRLTFGKAGAVTINGAAEEASMQALFHLLGWPVTWAGATDGTFAITRDASGFNADIRFEGEHDGFATFREGGELRGRVVGHGREWELSDIVVESGDGHLTVDNRSKIYMDKDGGGRFRILADLRNLQTGPLTFFGSAEVVGRWKPIDPSVGPSHPMDLDVFAHSLWINQFVLDGNITHLGIANQKLTFSPIPGTGQQISGALSYDRYPDLIVDRLRFVENGVEKVALSGNVGAREWDFTLATKALDAGVVRGLLDLRPPMSGLMNIDLRAKGSPAAPDIKAVMLWTNGRIGPLPLDSAEARIDYVKGQVTVTDATAQRRHGYVAQGNARFGIGEESESVPLEVNLKVDRGEMTLLEDMFSEVSKARGTFDGRLRIGGSAGNAAISGYLNAHKFSIASAHTPDLTRGDLRLRIERNRLSVDRGSARMGQGTLGLGGYVDFVNGRPSKYDLFVRSGRDRGISIRVPELDIAPGPVLGRFKLLNKSLAGVSRGEPVIDLALKGPADRPTLSGDVILENTVFTYPPASHRNMDGSVLGRGLFSNVIFDINLRAGKRVWYQNELVDANVTGALSFKGPAGDLDIRGRIRAEQGSIVYSGNEFRIKEAELDVEHQRLSLLTDKEQTVVYLKATAEREAFYTDALANSNQEVIVMVVDRAPIGEIQPRFYAKNNPGLSSQRALQLALGLPFGDNIDSNSLLPDQRSRISEQADNDKLLRLGLIQLLDSSLASPLARAIARQTGLVDYIRVSYQQDDPHAPEGITPADNIGTDVTQNEFLKYARGTKVKFGRGLGTRLFADYSFRVEEFESQLNLRHEVELAYRLHRNLFLRGTSELDRERELGRPPDRRAILENQWRFGLPRRRKSSDQPSGALPEAGEKAGSQAG